MTRDLEQALAHVRWIGGSACAGKTAIAERLAADYGLTIYHCDARYDDHRRRVDPGLHPRFHAIMGRTCEELWMRPASEQVTELTGFYQEELEMVLEDLTALRDAGPVLAEGAVLLPAGLSQVVAPGHAVWLIAGGELRRLRTRQRPRTAQLLAECRDPRTAFRRWMERDDRYAAEVAEQARRTGGRVLTMDGYPSVEDAGADVARHLGLA